MMDEKLFEETEHLAGNKPEYEKVAEFQRNVSDFVSKEVYYCASQIVSEVGNKEIDDWYHLFRAEDWQEPAENSVFEMERPDLEQALEYRGFAINAGETDKDLQLALIQDIADNEGFQEYCESLQLEPHESEIFEHWIVSDWLADKLAESGEVVEKDFYGLTIWGRGCTGQSISMDSVIQSIYKEFRS